MAQIPFQRGELTDRVRRFSGLVGPYSGSVDELVSPVLVTQDLARPPFRLVGQRYFCSAVQANPPDDFLVQLCHSDAAGNPATGVAVIDQLSYELVGWNGTAYAVTTYVAQRTTPLPASTTFLDLPIPEAAPVSGPFIRAPGFISAAPGPPLGPRLQLTTVLSELQQVRLPVELVLRPGCSLYWQFQQLATAAVTGFSMWVSGLWYPGGVGGEA